MKWWKENKKKEDNRRWGKEGEQKEKEQQPSAATATTTTSSVPQTNKRMIMFAEGIVPSMASAGQPSICTSLTEFNRGFHCFTSNALLNLDWSNVLCAGGACTASLLPVDPDTRVAAWFSPVNGWDSQHPGNQSSGIDNHQVDERRSKEYYSEGQQKKYLKRSKSSKSRDVDLFIYGLNEKEAVEKIKEIYMYAAIAETCVRPPLIIINGHAITFYREFPERAIQIVARLYKSPSEILMGFDIGSCCVGYNGTQVFVAPRTIRSLNTRCNMVDMSRRSLAYESRLFKYARRNFAVVVKSITRSEIDPALFDSINMGNACQIKGLAKLLMHEMSFRDFREPSCDCVKKFELLRECDGPEAYFGYCTTLCGGAIDIPVFFSHCYASKLKNSVDESAQPVSARDVFVHHRMSYWYNGNEDTYHLARPSSVFPTRNLKSLWARNKLVKYHWHKPWRNPHSIDCAHCSLELLVPNRCVSVGVLCVVERALMFYLAATHLCSFPLV